MTKSTGIGRGHRKNKKSLIELSKNKKASDRRYRLKRKFNLTEEKWEKIYNDQGGRCFICQRTEAQLKKSKSKFLAVDHCHKTYRIRGLLCTFCNRTLTQFFEEKPEIVLRVYKYLIRETDYGFANSQYNFQAHHCNYYEGNKQCHIQLKIEEKAEENLAQKSEQLEQKPTEQSKAKEKA